MTAEILFSSTRKPESTISNRQRLIVAEGHLGQAGTHSQSGEARTPTNGLRNVRCNCCNWLYLFRPCVCLQGVAVVSRIFRLLRLFYILFSTLWGLGVQSPWVTCILIIAIHCHSLCLRKKWKNVTALGLIFIVHTFNLLSPYVSSVVAGGVLHSPVWLGCWEL